MSNYNPEIHHRKSVRLKGYDYSKSGYYFVTINLDNVRCMLAVWNTGVLTLTPIGEIIRKYWNEIPLHYPNASMDEFVIMPDHLHGIIGINDSSHGSCSCKGVQLNAPTNNKPQKTDNTTGNVKQPNPYFAAITPAGRSLSVIIRNFKATVKHWCNEHGYPQFKWQRNFHEHIIRNDEELKLIRYYIQNNPAALQQEFPALKR